jgi:hypothetical protein
MKKKNEKNYVQLLTTTHTTVVEEENCEAIFRWSGSEFIILRIPNTENGTFSGQKKTVIGDQNLNSYKKP